MVGGACGAGDSEKGLSLHLRGDSHAGDFEQGGRNVDEPDFSGHAGGYALGGKMGFREFDQEWNVDGLIEEEDAVSFFAVSAEALALAGCDDDGGVGVELLLAQDG